MIGGLLVLLITGVVSYVIIDNLKRRLPFVDAVFLKRLFFYHLALGIVYYIYAVFNPSDSAHYYNKVVYDFRGESWGDFYGTSTRFIEFFGYPFVKYLGFSYEAMMALFSFFGFLGFVYFYVFFREHLRFRHSFQGFDLLKIFFLLPNLHFWSSSFGKGALVFCVLGVFFYGIGNIKGRVVAIIISGVLIYHIRPHIMLVVLLSSAIGFMFSTRGIGTFWRVTFLAGAITAFFFIYRDVLEVLKVDESEVLTQSFDFTHRATELSKATSGVDITSYSLPMQLFTFLYRPLFIDAPGMLGLFVSFENVFYLFLTIWMFGTFSGWRFLFTSGPFVKTAFLCFFTISLALAQVSGNLGIAMRQKSQVMILFLFVFISFLDEKKYQVFLKLKRRQKLRQSRHVTANNPIPATKAS